MTVYQSRAVSRGAAAGIDEPIVEEIELILRAANALLDYGRRDGAQWLAKELREIYARHPLHTGDISVLTSGERVIISRRGGDVRTLTVLASQSRWALVWAPKYISAVPATIAPLLAYM